MTMLYSSQGTINFPVAVGNTLVIQNISGSETVSNVIVYREDASNELGSGFVVYGPFGTASTVNLSTTGQLDYQIKAGDVTTKSNAVPVPVGVSTCVLLGDSRNDQYTTGTSIGNGFAQTKSGWNWFTWFQALNNQSLMPLAKFAVSGSQTSVLDGQVSATLAMSTLPQFAFIWSGINDQPAAVLASTSAANVKSACSRLISAGVTPVVFLDTGSTSINTSAKLQWLFEYNERLRDMADTDRRIWLFDATQTLWDPTSATWTSTPGVAFKSGYMADATHTANLGAYNLGNDFNTWFASRVPKSEYRTSTIGEFVNANNPLAYIANALFTTTTGGTTQQSGSVTGNVPGSWNLKKGSNAGTATTISTSANSGGFGNDLQLVITTTTADTVSLTQDASGAIKNGTAYGTLLQAGYEIVVSAGTNLTGVNVVHEYNDGSTSYTYYDLYAVGGGNGPQAFGPVNAQPFPMAVNANMNGVGWITTRVECVFSGAGGATVVIRRARYRRRYS